MTQRYSQIKDATFAILDRNIRQDKTPARPDASRKSAVDFRFDVGGQTRQKHHREKNQAADQETAGRDKETKSGLTPATFEIEAAL